MNFSTLSERLEVLESTNSRLEMMYQLADLFEALGTSEIKPTSYLIQGSLVPAYLSLEFQLSTKMLLRCLAKIQAEVADTSQAVASVDLFGDVDESETISYVEKQYKQKGDIGLVAQVVLGNWFENQTKNNSSLSIEVVYEKLVQIARTSGVGSQDKKINLLTQLLQQLDPVSAKYIARIVIGKLRLGFSAMTLLDALSWSVLKSKDHRAELESAYQKKADIGELAQEYLALAREIKVVADAVSEDWHLKLAKQLHKKYSVEPGIPVVPALCQRLNTAHEIVEKMHEVIVEPKYDGLRIQIHVSKSGFADGKTVKAYTRNLEDVSHMFPELKEVEKQVSVDSCILDAEAIGYDPQTEALLPFQQTITRKRKHEILKAQESVPIRFYCFDVLFSGSESLLEEKLHVRKESLINIIKENRTVKVAEYIVTQDPLALREFHEAQLSEGLEGAVIKQIDSLYVSGRKGWNWVKIKEAEGTSGKLKDTLDLIVMGYYFGRGKRSQFGIGAFLVGVLDSSESVKTIAKIGTGLTDEQFIDLKNRCDVLEVSTQPENYTVAKELKPDVWTRPELVVEIAADELTKSPNHSAGVALRFPRLMQFRDDKSWTDATTLEELEQF